MKRIIVKIARALETVISIVLVPVVFIISFLIHFPYCLLSKKV